MNPITILQEAWRITWKNGSLWLIGLLLFLVFLPAGILAGGFGAMAAIITLPPLPGRELNWLNQLRHLPAWVWILLAIVALVSLVITTAVSYMLQAAAMRGAAMAAEHGTFALKEALALGRQRVVSLLKISLSFGLLIAVIGLLPPLALVLLQSRFSMDASILNLIQTLLAPINIVLGLILLLVMMSVALEDLKPKAAFRRGWQVFRSGWWGFLFVIGLTFVSTFAVTLALVLLLVPFIVMLAFLIALSSASNAFLVGWLPVLACGGVLGPIELAILLFIAIFTLVAYTLTYREAARLTLTTN